MAEGFLRAMAGDRFDVASAGTEATQVRPPAIKAMNEGCPVFPAAATRLHWSFPDPSREERVSILLVEQNAQMALAIADHGYVMEGGRVVLDGAAHELRDNRNVREFYLGLTAEGSLKSYRDVKHYVRRKRWFSS